LRLTVWRWTFISCFIRSDEWARGAHLTGAQASRLPTPRERRQMFHYALSKLTHFSR
jgi:hypothetical protein